MSDSEDEGLWVTEGTLVYAARTSDLQLARYLVEARFQRCYSLCWYYLQAFHDDSGDAVYFGLCSAKACWRHANVVYR